MIDAAVRPVLSTPQTTVQTVEKRVTFRAFALGLLFSVGLAALNCWIEIVANVHFLGGVQMPFGSIFVLMLGTLGINWPLKKIWRPGMPSFLKPLSSTELLTIYAMALFAALISTPGADNFFLAVTPNLFYFASRENGWADLFYKHVPSWLAPGWDGQRYNQDIIRAFFEGQVPLSQIPWHAWSVMIIAWSVLLLCAYSTLFFTSLLLRQQWIENEALAFPLVQLPLQMVQIDKGEVHPPARTFWSNRTLWTGMGLAFGFHFIRGMNQYFPEVPTLAGFQGGAVSMTFTERPWNAMGGVSAELFLGAVGVAFLLTREVSFSFWFFFLAAGYQLVLADQFGFSVASLPRDSYSGKPYFIAYQSVGGWLMLGMSLLWAARGHLRNLAGAAWNGKANLPGEPFSPRFVLGGFTVSFAALIGWSWFAGVNPLFGLLFFAFYLGVSLIIARVVVEGGLLFPQTTFAPMEVLTTAITGTPAMGAATLTKLSFMQPSLLTDTRTNILPGLLHTLKLAYELKLDASNTRKLMGSVAIAIVVTLAVTVFTSLATVYSNGGLTGYTWFTQGGGKFAFSSAATLISKNEGVDFNNILWIGVGIAVTYGIILTRSRLAWFPLHPLGYIIAPSYPISRLWFSFFLGWLLKTLLNKYGGYTSVQKVQPFVIGLILGNVCGMIAWMLIGLRYKVQIPYWPA